MANRPVGLTKTRRRRRVAPWNPAASRDEARAYLQERLAAFSKLMFWIFWVLVIFVFALYQVYPSTRPAHSMFIYVVALTGFLYLGTVWSLVLRRRPCSIETLYNIDLSYLFFIGVVFGISAYFSLDKRANVYTAFIWHTFAVFTRVIIVPSTGRRSAVVTFLSFLPLLAASIAQSAYHPELQEIPPVAMIGGTLMFAVVAAVLASTGSDLIYGLRKQIREAQQLGQYTLGDKIAEGGMGAVYEAQHAMLRRPTAIKLLPLDRYGAESVSRFEEEVQHTSMLSHPNTVAIYDYGRTPDGVFYYAMEYLDGVDLERLVQNYGPLPAPRVARILHQVCGALGEAHFRSIIHHDVKPSNIMVCTQGRAPDVAKVFDFGLARHLTKRKGAAQSTRIAGTPAYVAPEIVIDPGRVGPHSDIYSLGAVGYFLLCGERLFDTDDPVELCAKHVTTVPPPPSERTDNVVPAGLEALIMRCLAKEPSDRPGSADDIARELSALPCYAAWSAERAAEWWTRHRPAPRGKGTAKAGAASTLTIDFEHRVG